MQKLNGKIMTAAFLFSRREREIKGGWGELRLQAILQMNPADMAGFRYFMEHGSFIGFGEVTL